MKPVRLVLAALVLSLSAAACGRTPTAPSAPAAGRPAAFDDNGGYMGSGLNTDTTKTPPPGN